MPYGSLTVRVALPLQKKSYCKELKASAKIRVETNLARSNEKLPLAIAFIQR